MFSSLTRRSRKWLLLPVRWMFPPRLASIPSIKAAFREGRIHAILVVRPQQGIGDMVLATALLKTLHAAAPGAQIDVVTNGHNVKALENNPRVGQRWVLDKPTKKNPFKLMRFLVNLRKRPYDIAFCVFTQTPSLTGYLISRWASRGPVVSFETGTLDPFRAWGDQLADVVVPYPQVVSEVRKYVALAAPFVEPEQCHYTPEVVLRPDAMEAAEGYWAPFKESPGPRVVLFPGGNTKHAHRLWSLENWAALARTLRKKGYWVAVYSVPPLKKGDGRFEERNALDELKKMGLDDIAVFSIADIHTTLAVLKKTDLFVTPDGGLFHLAVGAGIPTLGLFASTDPERWTPPVPWGHAIRVIENGISLDPERVAEAVESVTSRARKVKPLDP
jgi:ADP-heptose:LPS heptosyltransferase